MTHRRHSERILFLLMLAAVLTYAPARAFGSTVTLHETTLDVSRDGSEYEVRIEAWSPGASWEIPGKEGSALRLLIDGVYDQHLIVFAPSITRTSVGILGPLKSGKRNIAIEWDTSWSSDPSLKPRLGKIDFALIDEAALLRAPILYLRDDTLGRFSDVPLLMYWEYEGTSKIVYTVIFSNEDGGTNTERLMARWGRTTDIEWCYSHRDEAGSSIEEFQGPEHETLPFRGRKLGRHPLLRVATLNNNFTDRWNPGPVVRVRPSPVSGNLLGSAREQVLDRYPWTYALMAQEMIRENKLEAAADPGSVRVSDLRNYAYLEACVEQEGTELFFEIQLRGSARWFDSHHGDPKARIGRNGCFRTTIELPGATQSRSLRRLRIQCVAAPTPSNSHPVTDPRASILRVTRLFLLDRKFVPGPNLLDIPLGRTLRPGESTIVELR